MAAESKSPLESLRKAHFSAWTRRGGSWGEFPFAIPDLDRPARTGAVADVDRDGAPDVFIGGLGTHRVELLRSIASESRRWLRVRLRATGSAGSAFGATVVVESDAGTRAQVLGAPSGFQSMAPRELIFGLGAAEEARVRVLWPGQSEFESFGTIARDQTIELEEGAGRARVLVDPPQPLSEPNPDGVKLTLGTSPAAWTLRSTNGDVRRIEFGSKERLVLHLTTGDAPTVALESLLGDAPVVALALGPRGWTPEGRAAVAALDPRIEPVELDWKDAEHLRALDPALDLYSLELPTTLRFEAGRLVGIERHLVR